MRTLNAAMGIDHGVPSYRGRRNHARTKFAIDNKKVGRLPGVRARYHDSTRRMSARESEHQLNYFNEQMDAQVENVAR